MSFSDRYLTAQIITIEEAHSLDSWLDENHGDGSSVPEYLFDTVMKITLFDKSGVLN